jgi:hypothetical protein
VVIDPEDVPRQWVQWHEDGMWAPVFADGWTGEPVTAEQMLAARAAAAVLESADEPAALGVPVIDVDPVSVRDREEVTTPMLLGPGPEGACSDEPQVERDRP